MRVLYVAMTHDYGDPARGASFEETNFRSALDGMGHDLVTFDFVAREHAVGREAMNLELRRLAQESAPDVAFFVLFRDEIAPETIEAISAPTVNWFADDHWRFEDFTRHFAPSFDWAVTTDVESIPRYRELGYDRAILSQWACNRYAYDRVTDDVAHDVTFIGQPHGGREEIIATIQEAGLPIECWGYGWPNGRVDHEAMVRIFASSAINLNLSNSSTMPWTLRMRLGALVRRRRPWSPRRRSQIKGRTFEVPGSGGFLLTEHVPHLEEYFDIGKEIATFHTTDDLITQIRYWLEHPEERAAVADAGYRRVRAEHTYDHRFAAIFRQMGLA
jgi:spore maturation protein CgeB